MPSLIDRLFPPTRPPAADAVATPQIQPPAADAFAPPQAPAIGANGHPAPAAPRQSLLDRVFPPQRPKSSAALPASAVATKSVPGVGAPAVEPMPVTAVAVGAAGIGAAGVGASHVAATAAAASCPTCGAALGPEQGWCLSCGTEIDHAPTPSWRLGLAVAGSLLTLAAMGFALAYVAVSDHSQRATALAGRPGPFSTPPAATTPTLPTTPATTTPTPAAVLPTSKLPTPASATSGAALPSTSAGGATAGSTAGTGATSTSTTTHTSTNTSSNPSTNPTGPPVKAPSGPVPISFDPNAAQVFDPYGGSDHPELARYAIDGDSSTAWRTGDYAGGALNKPGVGILVDAAVPTPIKSFTIATPTPGFSLALYGARNGPPSTLGGWTLLASNSSANSKTTFNLAKPNVRYALVWITKLPPGKSSASISELTWVP